MSALLIDCLKEGLDPALAARLDSDETLRNDAIKYLNDLLVDEQLLSTDHFASHTTHASGKTTLTEEIAELDSKTRQIDEKLAALTNENRDLIIGVSQNLKAVSSRIDTRLDVEINAILLKINSMHTKWEPSAKARIRGAEKLAASNSVLFDIDPILDILELPTLCRLCILQGNYQEALEIAVSVKMLIIKFPGLQTFRRIELRIKRELQTMVKGLIRLLNTNLKQSNILKIFQILNRPDLMSIGAGNFEDPAKSAKTRGSHDRSLKLIYLNSRFKFITSELAALKPLLKLKKITYLKRCIEVYREHLANSLSIYHGIFHSVSTPGDKSEDYFLTQAYVKSLAKILVAGLREHFGEIAPVKSEDEADVKAQKDGLVLQLIYLCKSLDKYGLNFESMLTRDLCFTEPALVSEEDWTRSLLKVKKFRS